jgi:hypothetical protein
MKVRFALLPMLAAVLSFAAQAADTGELPLADLLKSTGLELRIDQGKEDKGLKEAWYGWKIRESRTAALGHLVREAPHVAEAHCAAGGREQEACLGRKRFSTGVRCCHVSCCPLIP